MRTTHRIDVHQHVVPPFWAKALPNHGGDPSGPRSGDPSSTVLPQWSPEDAIDLMDSQEIATGILSLTAPGIVGWDQRARREMARRVNEYTADLVAKRPDRFGHFATVPLPDVNGALSELQYALDTLRADGVILLGNYAEKYLGDATLEPLWAELHSRQAVVFVHPGLPLAPAVGVAGPLVDYPFDTTRTAVQLVLNGIVDRYPRARIILAHAGGFVPFASHRFAQLARVFRPNAAKPTAILASFRRFYFDTALSSSPAALPSLKAFAENDHILFGGRRSQALTVRGTTCYINKEPQVPFGTWGSLTLAMSYSRTTYRCTTIGAAAFHFRVRNGNGWCHCARITRRLVKPKLARGGKGAVSLQLHQKF